MDFNFRAGQRTKKRRKENLSFSSPLIERTHENRSLATSVYTTLRRINVSTTFHPPFFLPSFLPSFPLSPSSVPNHPLFSSSNSSLESRSSFFVSLSFPPSPRRSSSRFRFRCRRGRKGCVPRFVSRAQPEADGSSAGRGDSRCGYTRSGGRVIQRRRMF